MPATFDSITVTGAASFGSMNVPAGSITDASVSSGAALARSKHALETLIDEIPLSAWRVVATLQPLGATATSTVLGWYPGTYLTNSPMIRTADQKATTVTVQARCTYTLKHNYESAGSVTIRFRAGMVTTIADSATIDVEAAEIADATPGTDLVTTSATTINSLTFGNKDFVVTASGFIAGDQLDIRVSIAITDAATATAVIGAFSKCWVLYEGRG